MTFRSSAGPVEEQGKRVDDGATLRPLRPPQIFLDVDAVARHSSIRRAADALHVVSSALNRRILDLEGELGFDLFERLPRGVRPTASGEVFLAYVRRCMKDLRMVEAQVASLQGLVRGSVRIGSAESVTGQLLPEAVMDFQEQHPQVCFHVKVDGPAALRAQLLNDDVEMLLTHEELDSPNISVLATAYQPLCVLVAPDHPLAQQATAHLSDCIPYPLAMPDETLAARTLIDLALQKNPVRLTPSLVSNSIETTRVFASMKGGVCFQFRLGNQRNFNGMVAVPLADPDLCNPRLSLAVRRGRTLPPAPAAFAERLTRTLEQL